MKVQVRPTDSLTEDEKDQSEWNVHGICDNKTLRKILQPSLLSLAICGCYTYERNKTRTETQGKRWTTYKIIGTVYRAVFFIVLLSGIARCVAAFKSIPSTSMGFNIVMLSWYAQNHLMYLVSLKSNHAKYGGQRKAFELWDIKVKPLLDELKLEFPERKVKRRQTIYLIVASVLAVGNITGTILLATDTFTDGYSAFFTAPFSPTTVTLFTASVITVANTLVWMFYLFYIITLSVLLTSTFDVFNDIIDTYISRNALKMTCEFHNIRLLHLNLSKMVTELDRDLGYHFAIIFMFNVGNACYILFQILKTSMATLNLIMFIFWLVSCLATAGTIFVFAAFVNEAAHGSLDPTYYICVKDISTEQLGQLFLFLSKHTGTQIGFTTLGLLTITKEFLITIAGAFLTYFFLLYTL